MVTVKQSFKDIQSWLDMQQANFTLAEIAQFESAITLAESYYANQTFYPTNLDLLIHALTCANKVAELHLYADAVCATILYAIPKYCDNWQEALTPFGAKVIELVEGVSRVTQIRKLGDLADVANEDEKREQIEVMRKMLLAMASDIRVVLIVLVGRGELMLHLKSCKDEKMQQKIALETMELFAPLANRLGVWQIKWELEDLSFKYMHPEQYKKIAKLIDETREERLEYIERIKKSLSDEMYEDGIRDFQVMGRAKHIYSIWKKMKKKNYDFDDLYDIRAVRVLVPEIKDCYSALGIVHTKYSPIPGEFDDYISNPKSNNYQSLHTCVIGPENRVVEIQIRTFAMHDHAEYGIAAHWRYKEGGENNPQFEEKIAWIRQILDWREELTERKDIADIFKNEIFSDTIYVMTPNGKVISLPRGSTPIDFAYAVHSDVGHKCRGAKIDGHIVTLGTPLQNGQRVEILTIKQGGPSINWLHDGLVKSTKAVSHIRRWIRNQNNEQFINAGQEIFEREISKFPSNIRPSIDDIVARLNYMNEKEVWISLGKGDLAPANIRDAIDKILERQLPQHFIEDESIVPEVEFTAKPFMDGNQRLKGILVDGVSGIVTNIAKCCKPLPGDEIIGFISQGNGVTIHRNNCLGLKRQAKLYPNKVIPVSWGSDVKRSLFQADLEVIANDRHGLLRDITDLFAVEKLHIAGLRTSCKNNKAFMVFTLQISGAEFNFTWLINKLFNISGIIEVSRK